MADTKKPIDPEQKYDRQLRLWGKSGQKLIEAAHVCMLGTGPASTETLKNLVLPGLGQFTIIDGKKVSASDLGNNFFVTKDSVGKSIAAETALHLQELNADCKHAAGIERDPVDLIEKEPDFVSKYTLIIATGLPEPSLLKLGESCQKHGIPLIVIQSYGYVAHLRIVLSEHTIVESKPDFPPVDLRINDPFDELAKYARAWDFEKLNSKEHAHIPFPVILIKALDQWKASHNGALPKTTPEKDEFKKSILKMAIKADEVNFEEAVQAALQAFMPYQIPSDVQSVLDDPKTNVDAHSSNFWLMIAAIKQFVQTEGKGKYLPLMGSVPDMTAETNTYIELQKIYQRKAQEDQASVKKHLHVILKKVGKPENLIDDEELHHYVKHSLFLRVFRYRTLAQEYNPDTAEKDNFSWQLEDPLSNNIHWYLLLRAVNRFQAKHGHYPSSDLSKGLEHDLKEFTATLHKLLEEHGVPTNAIADSYIQEICRYGNSQLHNIGAVIGGVASQEIIKVITHQWIPLNNTYIFNGLDSNSSQYIL